MISEQESNVSASDISINELEETNPEIILPFFEIHRSLLQGPSADEIPELASILESIPKIKLGQEQKIDDGDKEFEEDQIIEDYVFPVTNIRHVEGQSTEETAKKDPLYAQKHQLYIPGGITVKPDDLLKPYLLYKSEFKNYVFVLFGTLSFKFSKYLTLETFMYTQTETKNLEPLRIIAGHVYQQDYINSNKKERDEAAIRHEIEKNQLKHRNAPWYISKKSTMLPKRFYGTSRVINYNYKLNINKKIHNSQGYDEKEFCNSLRDSVSVPVYKTHVLIQLKNGDTVKDTLNVAYYPIEFNLTTRNTTRCPLHHYYEYIMRTYENMNLPSNIKDFYKYLYKQRMGMRTVQTILWYYRQSVRYNVDFIDVECRVDIEEHLFPRLLSWLQLLIQEKKNPKIEISKTEFNLLDFNDVLKDFITDPKINWSDKKSANGIIGSMKKDLLVNYMYLTLKELNSQRTDISLSEFKSIQRQSFEFYNNILAPNGIETVNFCGKYLEIFRNIYNTYRQFNSDFSQMTNDPKVNMHVFGNFPFRTLYEQKIKVLGSKTLDLMDRPAFGTQLLSNIFDRIAIIRFIEEKADDGFKLKVDRYNSGVGDMNGPSHVNGSKRGYPIQLHGPRALRVSSRITYYILSVNYPEEWAFRPIFTKAALTCTNEMMANDYDTSNIYIIR